jgi:hypothetical protein
MLLKKKKNHGWKREREVLGHASTKTKGRDEWVRERESEKRKSIEESEVEREMNKK